MIASNDRDVPCRADGSDVNLASNDRDADRLLAWRRGDRHAGERLLAGQFDSILRFFGNRVRPDVAEDLTQRTFLLCAEGKERIRDEASVRAFLFAVARRVLCRHLRTKRRRHVQDHHSDCISTLRDPSPSSSALLVAHQERRGLHEALQRLPHEHQRVLELYYWDQHSSADVARALGVPHGTARTRLRRARSLLRQELLRRAAIGRRHRPSRRSYRGGAPRSRSCASSQARTSAI